MEPYSDSARSGWDLEAAIPWFTGRARRAFLLHPQPAQADAISDSRLGGPLWWPKDEPIPTYVDSSGADREMLPVLQLRRDDFPSIPFGAGRELLQITWRPGPEPLAQAHWRTAGDMKTMSIVPGPSGEPDIDRRSFSRSDDRDLAEESPCWGLHRARLLPEAVLEYPSWQELPKRIQRQFLAWQAKEGDRPEGLPNYEHEFGPSPSSKADGYPHWIWNDDTPICACGVRMEHLFSLATVEYLDGGGRWGWGRSNTRGEARREATGLHIPKFGIAYFHCCSSCPQRPVRTSIQSF